VEIGRIIQTEACVQEGAEWLAQREARFAEALAATGPLPLRRRQDGFEALLSAVVSQQLSVSAADSIWRRLEASGLIAPEAIVRTHEEDLRACGLSRPKIRYAKGLAESGLDFEALRSLPNDAVVAELTALKGIGKWTAQIYAMASLGRADVFAAGDLALQESARILFRLKDRPTEKELDQMAADWSPWRSVAARLLWAYYRVAKNREGTRS
jgi:DNA-3-methyladenine glycosylase II